MYDVDLNYFSIISGTNSVVHPAYVEAVKNVDKYTPKGAQQIKNFLTDIEDLASTEAVKDKRISDSKGNIHNFSGYKNINTVLSFLKKNLGKVEGVDDCDKVLAALERFVPQYTEGYNKQVRLIILEYESAVYILVTSLAMFMSSKLDFVSNGESIQIKKKNESTEGVIEKTLKGMAKILSDSNHKEYLQDLVKAMEEVDSSKEVKESYDFSNYLESVVGDTMDLIDSIMGHSIRIVRGIGKLGRTIKSTMFGIVPLIRSCIYLKYKKKADTIMALEDQAQFIELNIDQLKNRTNMDEKKKAQIIKKQTAAAEARRKKAAKLRAQLMETEKEASKEIKKSEPKIQTKDVDKAEKKEKAPEPKKNNDDDLVLEYVRNGGAEPFSNEPSSEYVEKGG